jgi:hypothetical protein
LYHKILPGSYIDESPKCRYKSGKRTVASEANWDSNPINKIHGSVTKRDSKKHKPDYVFSPEPPSIDKNLAQRIDGHGGLLGEVLNLKHFDYGDITDRGMATTNMSINSIQTPNSIQMPNTITCVNKNYLTVKEYYTNIHQHQSEFLHAPKPRQKVGVRPNMNHSHPRWA